MSYKGYNFFYTNGSSHTKGGGFETSDISGFFSEEMHVYYKNRYNVSWKKCEEVSYANRLSELLDIKVVNDSVQGGGLDRVIRKTYEFIESKWDERQKFFILLETPDASRIDLYYKPWKEYLIVNDIAITQRSLDGQNSLYGTTSYFPKPEKVDELQPDIQLYNEKFYNYKEHHNSNERKLLGLYCFCKRAGIPIKLMSGLRYVNHQDMYLQTDILSEIGTDEFDIINWAINNKKQIKHETNFEIIDGHPGYFAHIEYAEIWKNWLDKNLEDSILGTK